MQLKRVLFVLANSVTNSVTRKCSFQRHLCLVTDRKLLIPVRCTTRKFSLQPPPAGRNDWHVRFWAPKGPEGSSFVFRSTGTKEIAAAKRIAAQIIESFWTDAGRGAERLKLRSNSATIGQLIERYQANAVQRPRTVGCNSRSLRMIVRTVHKGDPDEKPTTGPNGWIDPRI